MALEWIEVAIFVAAAGFGGFLGAAVGLRARVRAERDMDRRAARLAEIVNPPPPSSMGRPPRPVGPANRSI